jgi:hypothetical protein
MRVDCAVTREACPPVDGHQETLGTEAAYRPLDVKLAVLLTAIALKS